MNNKEAPNEMHILKERAKELNCLYQVDEILNNQRFSLAEMFEALFGPSLQAGSSRNYVKQG